MSTITETLPVALFAAAWVGIPLLPLNSGSATSSAATTTWP